MRPCGVLNTDGHSAGNYSVLKKVHLKIRYFHNGLNIRPTPQHTTVNPYPLHTQIFSPSFVLVCASILFFTFKLTSHPLPINEMPHVDKMYIGHIVNVLWNTFFPFLWEFLLFFTLFIFVSFLFYIQSHIYPTFLTFIPCSFFYSETYSPTPTPFISKRTRHTLCELS